MSAACLLDLPEDVLARILVRAGAESVWSASAVRALDERFLVCGPGC